jgi:hypothetical protein
LGSLGATNQQKFIKDVQSSFMKEVNTIARTLSINNGKRHCNDTTCDYCRHCHMVVQLELGCTIGIDHRQLNENCRQQFFMSMIQALG